MGITIKQLEALVAIAASGSFRGAADRLNTTQPNISARIRTLEGLLGQPLMLRDAGSVRLTALGETTLAHARVVLANLDTLKTAAGARGQIAGVLRLGVTELVVHTFLHAYLRDLRRMYPSVVVELSVDISARLSEGLFAREIDLALQNGPFDRATTGSVELGAVPFVWVSSPSLGRELTATAAFGVHPVLVMARGTHAHAQIAEHFARMDGPKTRLAAASSIAANQQMARDGLGLACLPRVMVADDLAGGRLREVAYGWAPDPLRFVARFDAETAPAFVAAAARAAVGPCAVAFAGE